MDQMTSQCKGPLQIRTGVGVEGGGLIEKVGLQWILEITNPFITKFPKYQRYGF